MPPAAAFGFSFAITTWKPPISCSGSKMATLAFAHHTGGLVACGGRFVDHDQLRCNAARVGTSRRPPCSTGVQPAAPSRPQRPAQRRLGIACAASSSGSSPGPTSDYAALQGRRVYSAASGAEVELASLWPAQPGRRCVVVFLTHFADLSSTELAQKLKAVLPEVRGGWMGRRRLSAPGVGACCSQGQLTVGVRLGEWGAVHHPP